MDTWFYIYESYIKNDSKGELNPKRDYKQVIH